MTAAEVAEFVGAPADFTAADIAARDDLDNTETLKVGDRVFVTDATSEPDVNLGWAVYRVQSIGPATFIKISEQESLDVSITAGTNLSYTAAPNGGTVVNDGGDNAVLPLVDATNAGLASPAMLANSHPAAAAGLTASVNPININPTTQQATFAINQLDPLP